MSNAPDPFIQFRESLVAEVMRTCRCDERTAFQRLAKYFAALAE